MYTCVCIYVYIHIYIYIFLYIYIYTHTNSEPLMQVAAVNPASADALGAPRLQEQAQVVPQVPRGHAALRRLCKFLNPKLLNPKLLNPLNS